MNTITLIEPSRSKRPGVMEPGKYLVTVGKDGAIECERVTSQSALVDMEKCTQAFNAFRAMAPRRYYGCD